MAKGASYVVQYRRKREGRTNYKKRLDMLKSRKPRLVLRKTTNRMLAQVIEYAEDGDKIIAQANSSDLAKYGWKFSKTNLPAAYLTGFLCAKRSIASGKKEAVMDMGLHAKTKASRIYSALKGAVDAGLSVPADKEVFPDEKRISGAHIADYAGNLPEKDYEKRFSGYKAAGVSAKDITKHFQEVLDSIGKDFKSK